jgi:hypothetical protein
MKGTHTIRIVSRDKDRVDVSWDNIGAVELYNHTSLTILNPIKQDWRDWVNYVLHNEHKNSPSQKDIRKTLLEKSKAFESVLFGGKEWKKAEISKYIFITDPEWNLLPFEILPVDENYLLGEKYNVLRNIRSPIPIPDKKKGNGITLLWIQNHPKLKDSLSIEKDSLESIFNENKLSFDTILGRDNILNKIWVSLNSCEFVHFAGHSEKEGIYISENKILIPSEWEGIDLSNISLAFFNTCFSGIDSSLEEGLGRTLLKIGVRELVGFSHLVNTQKAIQFAIEFWKLFLNSRNSEYSVLQTRQILHSKFGENDITHLLFVHYSGKKTEEIKSNKLGKYFIVPLFVLGLITAGFYKVQVQKTEIIINKSESFNPIKPEFVVQNPISESIETIEKEPPAKEKLVSPLKEPLITPKTRSLKIKKENVLEKPISISTTNKKSNEIIKKESTPVIRLEVSNKSTTNLEIKDSKGELPPSSHDKKQDVSELQTAIEKFRNTYHPLLDEKEKEKIIKDILNKEEDDSVKRWILKKKTGF